MMAEPRPVALDEDHSAWRAMCLWLAERDACPCGCHEVIQPGLVPCPECEHSSRYGRPDG